VDGQLACRAGARRRLRIEVATGQVAREVAVSCELPPGQLVSLGNLRDLPTVVEHDLVAPGIGRLSFNLWMLPMLPRIEAALADLRRRGATSLVLDLRGNPGGVGTMAVPVAALLLQAEASLGRLTFRDFTNELRVRPAPGAFSGPVVALVDEGTASTSEIFLTGMRDAGRVQIVGGGPSAGAALPSVVEEIGGGALLQYVVGDYVSPAGARAEGKGITPDRVVAETRAAFAAGKDPVLDAAIEFLQGLPTPSPTAPP
jgi:carboxyl-terminal processing protease